MLPSNPDPSSAGRGAGVHGRGHQRQPERRAHLHQRRTKPSRAWRGIASLFPGARPPHCAAPWTIRWFAASLAANKSLRRAPRLRAAAPWPPPPPDQPPAIAVGGHLKNTVALAAGGRVILSQHIGDLETPESFEAFRDRDCRPANASTASRLPPWLPTSIPVYRSSQFARQSGPARPARSTSPGPCSGLHGRKRHSAAGLGGLF